MKNISGECVKATYDKMDPHRKTSSFEIFGLDYMIDE